MARTKASENLHRFRLNVPDADADTLEWIASQESLSISLRLLIKNDIAEAGGISDVICRSTLPQEQVVRRRGRPSKSSSLPGTVGGKMVKHLIESYENEHSSNETAEKQDEQSAEARAKPVSKQAEIIFEETRAEKSVEAVSPEKKAEPTIQKTEQPVRKISAKEMGLFDE